MNNTGTVAATRVAHVWRAIRLEFAALLCRRTTRVCRWQTSPRSSCGELRLGTAHYSNRAAKPFAMNEQTVYRIVRRRSYPCSVKDTNPAAFLKENSLDWPRDESGQTEEDACTDVKV